jgi:hypothetical protein
MSCVTKLPTLTALCSGSDGDNNLDTTLKMLSTAFTVFTAMAEEVAVVEGTEEGTDTDNSVVLEAYTSTDKQAVPLARPALSSLTCINCSTTGSAAVK